MGMRIVRELRRKTVRTVLGLVAVAATISVVAPAAHAQLQSNYVILGKDPDTQTADNFIHADIGVAYILGDGTTPGEWDMHIHLDPPVPGFEPEYEPDQALLYVSSATRTTLGAGTDPGILQALGVGTGAQVNLIPRTSPATPILWLGVGAEENDPGDFVGGLQLALLSVTHTNLDGTAGSGNLAAWRFDDGGNLDVRMSSAPGSAAPDFINLNVGAHDHYAWGFSLPGFYEVTFEGRGTPIDGGPTSSGPVTYYFGVETTQVPAASAAVPEAGTVALAGMAVVPVLGGLAVRRRRKTRRA